MQQGELLDWTPSYPQSVGYKEPTTSKLHAERLTKSGRAQTLREKVLAYFEAGHSATADEVAEALGEPFIAIRPRCSELRAMNLIKPTGERRNSACGGASHVWCKA